MRIAIIALILSILYVPASHSEMSVAKFVAITALQIDAAQTMQLNRIVGPEGEGNPILRDNWSQGKISEYFAGATAVVSSIDNKPTLWAIALAQSFIVMKNFRKVKARGDRYYPFVTFVFAF